jgi:hypothetical protein
MKKHISIAVLFILMLPSVGLAGIKSSAFQKETTDHKAVAWGYKCVPPSNFEVPDFFKDPKDLRTFDKLLDQHGYITDLKNNPNDPTAIQSSFNGTEIFFFIGHGNPTAIGITLDNTCEPVATLTKDDLNNLDTRNLSFVLLSACEVGKDYEQPNNILRAFKAIPTTKKVIGFNRFVNQTSVILWSQKFWKYTLQDGMEVSEAAYLAAGEVEQMFLQNKKKFWLTSAALEIKGTEPVYLGYKESSPSLGQRLGQLAQNLWSFAQDKSQQMMDWITEWVKNWWAKHWPEWQKSIENWLRNELSKLFQQFIHGIEKFIRETCLQPVGFALVFTGVLLYWKRR